MQAILFLKKFLERSDCVSFEQFTCGFCTVNDRATPLSLFKTDGSPLA